MNVADRFRNARHFNFDSWPAGGHEDDDRDSPIREILPDIEAAGRS